MGKYRGNNAIAVSLQILHKRIGDVRPVVVGDARGRPLYVLHQSIEIIARIGYADHTNGGAIPKIAGIEFSDEGSHAIRGVPDEWHLFAVQSA